MPRHYSTRDFFRQMPNVLLARYFQGQGLFGDLDFAAMKEGKPDELFAAWLALPDNQRNAMDAEFRDIFEMSCEKGFRAIIDEASWQMREEPDGFMSFIEMLSALSNHYERAMITFWITIASGGGRPSSIMRIRCHTGANAKICQTNRLRWTRPAFSNLAALIRNYFHHTEGRGKNCVVEPFRRGELDYFFAYPEDYSQQSIEWVNGEFDRRPHNPAFEVIYVYSQKEGSLDLNFRGSYKSIEPLQGMFAQAILKLDGLPPDPKDERVYDLNPLLQKGFNFIYDAGSGIERVTVKKLRLSSRMKKGDRITLEADSSDNPDAVYDLLDEIRASLRLSMYNVTQVELAASVVTDADKPAKKVTIRITYPNSCSLRYDEIGLKLRAMLEASGIEPKEPAENAGAEA